MKKLILLLLIFAGCKVQQHTSSVYNDSIRVEVREVTTVDYQLDTVFLEIPSESRAVITEDSSFLSTSVAYSTAKIDSFGMLHHTLDNIADTQPKTIEVPVYYHTRDSIYLEKAGERIEVPIRMPLTKWQGFMVKSGFAFWLMIICGLVFLAIKTF